ncbi:acyltransferase [Paenibacillus aquistagni]|uniref:Surface polysaccharide O-acyltransferase, integral membrane enzyme n=1 Tax=Paenibacillus aquistagni TaxID=1852522 RepID=A0A1X7JN37_9BACL|nr:acyltransferase family protein [Paenibacillus aquistagni]SMG29301.1 Surface polysaccharide O-acyltransferase, integral membrane enzyme [Paenibacillus aquistagni]
MNSIFKNNRIIYIDLLRVLSIVAVVILHITADLLTRTNDFDSASWWVNNILNSIARFAVPVFFMISGAMILRVKITSYREFYLKRVLPLVIPLVSWSLIYALYNQYVVLKSNIGVLEFLKVFGYNLLVDRNYVHLWFLYAIIAIYMTVPLVSKMVKACEEKDIRYFLIMWFIVSIGYRFVTDTVFQLTGNYFYMPILNIPFFTGYLGYFVLGYYLYNYEISLKARNLFFNLGIISFFLTPIATYFVSMQDGVLDEMFYGNYSLTTFFMAIGLFLYFQEKEPHFQSAINYKVKKMIGSVSKASFSIYLIHLLVEIIVAQRISTQGAFWDTSLHLLINIFAVLIVSYISVKVLQLSKVMTRILFGGRG